MRRLAVLAVIAACSHADSWSVFRSDDGKFSAEFPGTPKLGTHDTVTVPTVTTSHTVLVQRGVRGSFQVSYYELAMKLGADTIESAAKLDCMSSVNGTWTSTGEHPQQLGSVKGYAVITTSPKSDTLPDGGYAEDRCFVAGTRMYHLIAVGPDTADQRRDAERFLGSFKLL